MKNILDIINSVMRVLDIDEHIHSVYHGEKDNEIEFSYLGEEYKITIEKISLEAHK